MQRLTLEWNDMNKMSQKELVEKTATYVGLSLPRPLSNEDFEQSDSKTNKT